MQPALTMLPFLFGALKLATVKLAKGVALWNIVHKLPPDPIPESTWKTHVGTVIATEPIRGSVSFHLPAAQSTMCTTG